MSHILAIDPGNVESGWVWIEAETCRPIKGGKTENHELREALRGGYLLPSGYPTSTYIEMVASYGMAVGASVFETCVWIGRFVELAPGSERPQLVKRQPVKLHHCKSAKAKDANVRQALIDRFAKDVPNGGKGSKAEPGWFYGFKADMWQAYALAVYAADVKLGRE